MEKVQLKPDNANPEPTPAAYPDAESDLEPSQIHNNLGTGTSSLSQPTKIQEDPDSSRFRLIHSVETEVEKLLNLSDEGLIDFAKLKLDLLALIQICQSEIAYLEKYYAKAEVPSLQTELPKHNSILDRIRGLRFEEILSTLRIFLLPKTTDRIKSHQKMLEYKIFRLKKARALLEQVQTKLFPHDPKDALSRDAYTTLKTDMITIKMYLSSTWGQSNHQVESTEGTSNFKLQTVTES